MELIFVPLIFTCLFNIAFSADVKVEVFSEESIVKYNISKDLVLQCIVKNGNASALGFTWKKDDMDVIDSLKDRATYSQNDNNVTMIISKAVEEDAGKYTCVTKDGDSASIIAATSINVNTPDNVNVVEGEKLRILCAVVGKPSPQIQWTVGEMNYSSSSGHITLQADPDKNITNAVLLIDNVNITHKGSYKCIAHSMITNETVSDEAMVRVKDKYAALWPFLGICLEVFVLCAVILIYEKKRNKTELEESDTDQSPDQKNTPDHGKDSNLRHRQ